MRRFIVLVALLVVLVAGVASVSHAFAADPGTQGQPNQSCQSVFPSGTFTPCKRYHKRGVMPGFGEQCPLAVKNKELKEQKEAKKR